MQTQVWENHYVLKEGGDDDDDDSSYGDREHLYIPPLS